MLRIAQRSGGFTLVELLVVVAIFSVLISMLLPAIQQIRESARRAKCSNNLRQLGLAIHNYESSTGIFPGGGIIDFGNATSTEFQSQSGPMLSWIVLILPHIEQQNLADLFDFSTSSLEQLNEPQATQPPSFICPSDRSLGRFYASPTQTNQKRFAKGNYAAFASPFHVELQIRFPGAISGRGNPIAAIRDGTSNTLMLAEVRTREHEQDQRGAWALPWNASTLLAFDMHHAGGPGFRASPGSLGLTQRPNSGTAETNGDNLTSGAMDVIYGCPDFNLAQLEKMPCGDYERYDWLSAAPRSLHPGGVNVVNADGSTSFYRNDVDEYTMAYAISIDDGNVVNSEH